MMSTEKYVICLASALALSAAPSLAKGGERHMSAARAASIHECNVKASKYIQTTWGDVELYVYRACMAEHHQSE